LNEAQIFFVKPEAWKRQGKRRIFATFLDVQTSRAEARRAAAADRATACRPSSNQMLFFKSTKGRTGAALRLRSARRSGGEAWRLLTDRS